MRTSCIKVLSEDEDGALMSLNNINPFSQVYREPDGTINTVKSSLVFTEPDDAARFIRIYCPALKMYQVWIASADTIEPRDWIFLSGFLNDLHYYKDDPAIIRMKELVLQCCNKAERPEDDQELIEALDDLKDALGDWMPRIRVIDAPKGTFIATNLRLEKCIDFPEIDTFEDLSFEKTAERISKTIMDEP